MIWWLIKCSTSTQVVQLRIKAPKKTTKKPSPRSVSPNTTKSAPLWNRLSHCVSERTRPLLKVLTAPRSLARGLMLLLPWVSIRKRFLTCRKSTATSNAVYIILSTMTTALFQNCLRTLCKMISLAIKRMKIQTTGVEIQTRRIVLWQKSSLILKTSLVRLVTEFSSHMSIHSSTCLEYPTEIPSTLEQIFRTTHRISCHNKATKKSCPPKHNVTCNANLLSKQ